MKYKETSDRESKTEYQRYRNLVSKMIKKQKHDVISCKIQENRKQPKKLWSIRNGMIKLKATDEESIAIPAEEFMSTFKDPPKLNYIPHVNVNIDKNEVNNCQFHFTQSKYSEMFR